MNTQSDFKLLVSLVLVIVFFWLAVPVFSFFAGVSHEDAGQFGDMYGVLNSLFAGLAFAAIVWTVFIQKTEIRESTRTLELQTRAQLLTSLKELSMTYSVREGIEIIAAIDDDVSLEDFASLPPEDQKKIGLTVEFLNHAAHLVFTGLLKTQDIWNSYFLAFELCQKKLVPNWLVLARRGHPARFQAFADMCSSVAAVTEDEKLQFRDYQEQRRLEIIEAGRWRP